MAHNKFRKQCWVTNFILPDGTRLAECTGKTAGVCDRCGFCMAGEMRSVFDFKIDTIRASMNVTIRGLQGLSGSSGGDYSLVVRETTGSIDFGGIYGGDRASYSVRGSMNGRKEYVVPSFRLFPVFEGEGLIIDIYRDGSLLRSVTLEDDGSPIVPEVGTTLNVLLNFEGHVSVSVAVTKWNVVHIWKEYD